MGSVNLPQFPLSDARDSAEPPRRDPEADCVDGPCDPNIPRNDGSSARRYPAVRKRLEPYAGRIRLGDVQATLALTEGRVLNDGTLLACVFEPQLGRFHLATRDGVDPVHGRLGWQSYALDADALWLEANKKKSSP